MNLHDLDALYRQNADTVFRWLSVKTGSDDLAEELTQETFYQAVKSIDRYDGSCQFSTWLIGIAKNVLRTHRRKHPPTEAIEDQPLQTPSAEAEAISADAKLSLMRRLHALPEPYREIIYLRSLGNLSFREIGELLGRSENWARVTFYRAKEKLGKDEDHAKPSL